MKLSGKRTLSSELSGKLAPPSTDGASQPPGWRISQVLDRGRIEFIHAPFFVAK